MHRFSSGTNFAASSMRRHTVSISSNTGDLLVIKPNTTRVLLLLGKKRNG